MALVVFPRPPLGRPSAHRTLTIGGSEPGDESPMTGGARNATLLLESLIPHPREASWRPLLRTGLAIATACSDSWAPLWAGWSWLADRMGRRRRPNAYCILPFPCRTLGKETPRRGRPAGRDTCRTMDGSHGPEGGKDSRRLPASRVFAECRLGARQQDGRRALRCDDSPGSCRSAHYPPSPCQPCARQVTETCRRVPG